MMGLGRAVTRVWGLGAVLTGAVVAMSGCATNPVTGEQDFVLMSEERELALGREFHPQILDQYGKYESPELQRYVQSLGETLAAKSHRPDLFYRFTVLDSPEVNAFALPGGYIYITRGLMAYLNSEAELAAVLGHEIGHVTARHAVKQHSAATVTSIIGGILAAQAESRAAQDLARVVGTAIIRGYGRDMELEADRLGARYLARTGYDPDAMLAVLKVLKAHETFEQQRAKAQGREPMTYHGLFATHPSNDKRLQEVVGGAKGLETAGSGERNREPYLQQLQGLVFGDSPKQGIRRGSAFYHPVLDFALRFPDGWFLDNRPDRLLARAGGGDAALEVTLHELNKRISPREFLHQRLDIRALEQGSALQIHGLDAYTGVARGGSPFGRRPIRVVVVFLGQRALVFLGATKAEGLSSRYDSAFMETARSLHRLTAAERALAEPMVIRVIDATAQTRYSTLAERSPIPNAPQAQLRLLNGHYPQGQPRPGQTLKVVE